MSEDVGALYATLTDAMLAGDELAEAVKRYRMLDETFREAGARERKALSLELNALMEKITRLRANKPATPATPAPEPDQDKYGRVVPIDAARFQKPAGATTPGPTRKESL